MTRTHTERALVAAARPLRHSLVWLGTVGAGAVLALVLAIAAWSARAGVVHSPIWVPAAWVLAFAAALVCGLLAWRAAHGFRASPLAGRLEGKGVWRAGALRSLLQPPAEGTSSGLLAAADDLTARDLTERAPGALEPERRHLGRLLRFAAVSIVLGAGLLGAAGVRRGPAALLWRPGHALAMVVSPLRLEAGTTTVKAGDSVALLVIAPGRRSVTLWTRSPGTTWAAIPLALDSAGRATRSSGPLTEALFAHVTEGRRS